MDQLRKWVDGKIVLVGTDFAGRPPRYAVLHALQRHQMATPGVEIHANTVRTLLTRSYLVPAPQWALALALLLATTLTVSIVTSFAAGRAVGLVLLEVLGVLAATHLLFERGFILSTSEVLLATSMSLIASLVYRYATEETRGNLFHRAVSLFVGKQLASSLEESRRDCAYRASAWK